MAQLIKCLVVILSLHSFSYLTEADEPHRYWPFDLFLLVLSWPPAFCTRRNCLYTPIPRDFIIHGLWPNNYTGPKLEYCEPVAFAPITDEVLLERVKANWIGLATPTTRQFTWWKYQWEIHGTCSMLYYYQMGYFDLAVEMREDNDIFGYLASNGILPTHQDLYAVADIRNVIQQRTGKVPHLYCEQFNQEIQMLVEVTLCFHPDGEIIDCQMGPWEGGCTDTHVYYIPPYHV